MNRRTFLRFGAAAIAAVTLPVSVEKIVEATPDDSDLPRMGRIDRITFYDEHSAVPENLWNAFNPEHRYGNGMLITDKPSGAAADRLIETLYKDMVKWIPPNYRERVSVVGPTPVDYGRAMNISWMYTPHRPVNVRAIV